MDTFIDAILNWIATLQPGEVIWWVAVAVAAVLIVWKGWPLFRKFVKALYRFTKLVDTLATLPDELGAIRHQLEHNGGGSVKDAVVRTENALGEMRSELSGLRAEVADVKGDVATVSGDVAHVRRQAAALKTSIAKTKQAVVASSPPA